MSDFLSYVNDWVIVHKELLSLIGIPFLTWIVAHLVTKSAERRSAADRKAERELRRALKISDFRLRWIENLRNEFTKKLALDVLLEPFAKDDIYKFNLSLNTIVLSVNPSDQDFRPILNDIQQLLRARTEGKDSNVVDLRLKMQSFLKKEWEKLKKETEEAIIP